ncbi:hypothetical protein HJC23_013982 [Cyclotella cryptica]|uniref:DDE Tnp4 domain-containing protein n=1 Tax=Cyclotella cryptica TaxID=29204 RepID=A0ABD3Q3J0_9STRA
MGNRKGLFGLNVQAIVDNAKRHAEHNSMAFKYSKFNQMLLKHWEVLLEKGLYILGNSSYPIKSFLLMPFDNVFHGTLEDSCSTSFIRVEELGLNVPLEKLICTGAFFRSRLN